MLEISLIERRYGADAWGHRLGVQPVAWETPGTRLRVELPYRPTNMNMTGRTHGGILASFLHDAAKLLVAGQSDSESAALPQTLDFQIAYLAAGGRETLTAVAELSRRTRSSASCSSRRAMRPVRASPAPRSCSATRPPAPPSPIPISRRTRSRRCLRRRTALARFAPMVKLFNQAMGRAHPGCSTEWMGDGLCLMRQADIPDHRDWNGEIAPGQILTLLDNTGGGAGCSLASDLGMAVTLGIRPPSASRRRVRLSPPMPRACAARTG